MTRRFVSSGATFGASIQAMSACEFEDPEARRLLRQQRARPVADALHNWRLASDTAPPTTTLATVVAA